MRKVLMVDVPEYYSGLHRHLFRFQDRLEEAICKPNVIFELKPENHQNLLRLDFASRKNTL